MNESIPPAPSSARTTDRAPGRGHLAGAAASAGLALAWLGLSWWHPALTYHFGPLLAVAAWPLLLRWRLRQPARRGQALAAVAGGFLIAMAALGVAVGHCGVADRAAGICMNIRPPASGPVPVPAGL